MPPVFGPESPSPNRLKSWAGASAANRSTVAQHQQRALDPGQPLLDHDLPAGLPEGLPRQLGVHVGVRLLQRVGDQHALPGGQAVGLDHPGSRQLAQESLGRLRVGEHPEPGGGHAGLVQHLLHEGLGALQLGPVRPGPEHQPAGRPQPVGQPVDQRGLRPDDEQIGVDLLGGGGHAGQGVTFRGGAADPRVARGDDDIGGPAEGQGQGVLPASRADHADGLDGSAHRRRLMPRSGRTAPGRGPPRPVAPGCRSARTGSARSRGPPGGGPRSRWHRRDRSSSRGAPRRWA